MPKEPDQVRLEKKLKVPPERASAILAAMKRHGNAAIKKKK